MPLQPSLARVDQLWVFPVKSMSGTSVGTVDVVDGGLVGDRSWAVVDDSGETVTAKQEPRLREVVARLVDGELHVDVPEAAPSLGAEEAAEALSSWLGRPLRLEHRGGAGFVDVAPVHLVSTAALTDAAHAEECDSCDIAAPRANVVLELITGAGSERDWVGHDLSAGSARLSVVRVPKHCLGVYADVAAHGTLTVGDEVRSD
ncbi:MAG: MOSC N-terminal beta barrel domain-containing protein [Sporichthyaceae bacterium]|nr:MOSC N-terminal beta barrel domain-containing protein [Sporichthyaceae bacterium]